MYYDPCSLKANLKGPFYRAPDMIHCPTCHAPLLGTKQLKQHVEMNLTCKWMKTSSPEEMAKEIQKEVKRQRSRMAYGRNPGKKKVAVKQAYDRNPQKKKDAVKQNYDRNPQRERDRKKVSQKQIYDQNPQKKKDAVKQMYDRNPQKKKDTVNERYEAANKTRDTAGDLQKFLEEGRYGPIFRYCS